MKRLIKHLILLFLIGISHCLSAGDHPCSATVLATNAVDFTTYDNASNSDSGIPPPPYGGYTGADIWFSFIMPAGGPLYLLTQPGTMIDPALAIYKGPCSDPILIYDVIDNNCDGSESPMIIFDELIPGQNYYIRIWAENGSPNGTFELLLSQTLPTAPVFLAFAEAMIVGDCIELTQNTNTQQGCAWYQDPIDFTIPFTHEMTANFGTLDGNGADGICLVYQSNGQSFCGGTGEGIGAGGMPNSAIFEFDTWQNGNLADPAQDHCSFNINGNMNHNSSIQGPALLGNIEDGLDHTILFEWNPVGNMYSLYFDNVLMLSGSYDIINNCFGGSTTAFWGYTSATGASTNLHEVCPVVPEYDFGTQTYEEVTICAGSDYLGYSTPGFYVSFLPGANGCLAQTNTLLSVAETTMIMDGPFNVDCNNTTATLGTTITSNLTIDNIIYNWTGPAGTSSNPTWEVDQPGLYSLTAIVEYDGIQCIVSDITTVIPDTISPQIVGLQDITITCDTGSNITAFDAGGSIGSNLSFQWLYNGSFLSTNSIIDIVGEGTYTLEIIDGINGCSDIDEAVVTASADIPSVSILGDTLNCKTKAFDLDATVSTNVTMIEWFYDDQLYATMEDPAIDTAGVYTILVETDDGCVDSASFEVILDTLVPVLTVDDGIILCDQDSAVVSFFIDSALYDVVLLNNTASAIQDSNFFTVYDVGTYFVDAVNPHNHCSFVDSFNISSLGESPEISLMTDTLDCQQTSVTLQLDANQSGLNYQWTLNNNAISMDEDPSVGNIGNYIVSAISNTGCTTIDSILVVENISYPEIMLDAEVIDCDNLEAEVQATIIGGDQISWVGPNGFTNSNLDFETGDPGYYYITVTDSGNQCATLDTIEIISEANVPIFSFGNDTLNCNVEFLNIDFLISSSYDYLDWSGPNGFTSSDENPYVEEGGLYTLHIEVDGSCDIDTMVFIEEDFALPNFTVSIDSVTCNKPFAEVEVENLIQENHEIIVVQPDGTAITNDWPVNWTAGQYIITYIRKNGCSLSDTIFIESFTDTPEASIFLNNDLTCAQQSALLSATSNDPSMTYLWEGPSGETFVGSEWDIAEEGIYNLNIIDQYGCENVYTQLVQAFVELPPIQVDGGNINCAVLSTELTVTSQEEVAAISWMGPNDFINNQETIEVSDEGWYVAEIWNEYGCANTDSIFVEVNKSAPEIILETEDSVQIELPALNAGLDISVISDMDYDIEWIPSSGLSCDDCLHPRFIERGADDYQVVVTDENGCMDTIAIAVRYKEAINVYIPNIFSPENDDNLNEGFTLFADENVAIINEMLVYDRWGEQIYSNSNILPNNPLLGWDGRYKGQPVIGGVYVYYFKVTSIYDEEFVFVGDVTALD